jgi:hypothetical protein
MHLNVSADTAMYGIAVYNRTLEQNRLSVNIHGNNNRVNIEEGQQSANSGGGSGGSDASMSECRAFCSKIG